MPGKTNLACEYRAQKYQEHASGDYAFLKVSLDMHPIVKTAGYLVILYLTTILKVSERST